MTRKSFSGSISAPDSDACPAWLGGLTVPTDPHRAVQTRAWMDPVGAVRPHAAGLRPVAPPGVTTAAGPADRRRYAFPKAGLGARVPSRRVPVCKEVLPS